MNSILIGKTLVIGSLIVILCIALLVGSLLLLDSIAGAHATHMGIMLITLPLRSPVLRETIT
jgi:hypothetical protein